MFNIKFMGKYTDESQIMRDILPKNAVKFKEPNTITKVFLLGSIVSSPILILSTLLLFSKMDGFFDIPLFPFIIALVFSLGLLYVHELIHALSFPKHITKEIWTWWEEGALFVNFYEPITKINFILMSLAPNIVLGFIPFFIYMLGAFDFNTNLSTIIGITSWIMILSGVGDYLNVFNAIRQVPKGSYIVNHGFHSYWFE